MNKIILALVLALSVNACNAGPALAVATYGVVRLACFLPGQLSTIVTMLKADQAEKNNQPEKAKQIRMAGSAVSTVATAGAIMGSHEVAKAASEIALRLNGI